MKILGIIAEYNPMHTGHIYHIKKAKEITKADYVVCIMSGSFTQQGNIAIQDKFTRAKDAILSGIDVVIELPTPFAISDGGSFAKKAIQLLNDLNIVDYMCFGAETDNMSILKDISSTLIKEDITIWKNIKRELKLGVSFATARNNVLSNFVSDKEIAVLNKPNNILAIEYLKSLEILNSTISPIVIKRITSDFNSKSLENNFTSSTSIREELYTSNELKNIKKYVSKNTYDNLLSSKLLFNNDIFEILKYKILSMTLEDIKNINGVTEGLENKIKKEIVDSFTYDEYIFKLKSKRYELSKIKRILINIILNISKSDFKSTKESTSNYAHILAFNHEKREILSILSSNSKIPIITNLKKITLNKLNSSQLRLLNFDIYSSNIHSMLNNSNMNKDYTNLL